MWWFMWPTIPPLFMWGLPTYRSSLRYMHWQINPCPPYFRPGCVSKNQFFPNSTGVPSSPFISCSLLLPVTHLWREFPFRESTRSCWKSFWLSRTWKVLSRHFSLARKCYDSLIPLSQYASCYCLSGALEKLIRHRGRTFYFQSREYSSRENHRGVPRNNNVWWAWFSKNLSELSDCWVLSRACP